VIVRDNDVTGVFFIGILFGISIGLAIEYHVMSNRYQQQAIQHNAGQYNPTTGRFEWIDKSLGEKEFIK